LPLTGLLSSEQLALVISAIEASARSIFDAFPLQIGPDAREILCSVYKRKGVTIVDLEFVPRTASGAPPAHAPLLNRIFSEIEGAVSIGELCHYRDQGANGLRLCGALSDRRAHRRNYCRRETFDARASALGLFPCRHSIPERRWPIGQSDVRRCRRQRRRGAGRCRYRPYDANVASSVALEPALPNASVAFGRVYRLAARTPSGTTGRRSAAS